MKAKKGRNNDKLNKNRIETKLQNMDKEGIRKKRLRVKSNERIIIQTNLLASSFLNTPIFHSFINRLNFEINERPNKTSMLIITINKKLTHHHNFISNYYSYYS